jgi:hypothetical protein
LLGDTSNPELLMGPKTVTVLEEVFNAVVVVTSGGRGRVVVVRLVIEPIPELVGCVAPFVPVPDCVSDEPLLEAALLGVLEIAPEPPDDCGWAADAATVTVKDAAIDPVWAVIVAVPVVNP